MDIKEILRSRCKSCGGVNLPMAHEDWRTDSDVEEIHEALLAMGDEDGLLSPETIQNFRERWIAGEWFRTADFVEAIAKHQLALATLKYKGEIKNVMKAIFEDLDKRNLDEKPWYQEIKAKYLGNEGVKDD